MNLHIAVHSSIEAARLPDKPLHLAIGMFDGVHLGHQAVIEAAIHQARRANGVASVLTFTPHPSKIFRPDSPTRLILDDTRKQERLAACGIGDIIAQPFTPEFGKITAEAFASRLKSELPYLTGVYVGDNFRFGKGRAGGIDTLVSSFHPLGVDVYSVPRIKYEGEPISSTRIRNLLLEGELNMANKLLGYNYYCLGKSLAGKALGRKIGFPTVNLTFCPDLCPRLGVYAVRAWKNDESNVRYGVANYGLRPTVEDTNLPTLEIHFLDSMESIPGDTFRVEWLSFLRPEMRFDSIDDLVSQIARDKAHAIDAIQAL